jgi:hypothetical protein
MHYVVKRRYARNSLLVITNVINHIHNYLFNKSLLLRLGGFNILIGDFNSINRFEIWFYYNPRAIKSSIQEVVGKQSFER